MYTYIYIVREKELLRVLSLSLLRVCMCVSVYSVRVVRLELIYCADTNIDIHT